MAKAALRLLEAAARADGMEREQDSPSQTLLRYPIFLSERSRPRQGFCARASELVQHQAAAARGKITDAMGTAENALSQSASTAQDQLVSIEA